MRPFPQNLCDLMQGISAVAADAGSPAGRAPLRLALAVKPARRTARVMVFQLTPGGAAMGTTVKLLSQAEVASALPIQVRCQRH